MQFEARVAYTEPRNIHLTMLCVLNNIRAITQLGWNKKNITFGKTHTQNYRTYLLVCDFNECPLELLILDTK